MATWDSLSRLGNASVVSRPPITATLENDIKVITTTLNLTDASFSSKMNNRIGEF